MTSRCQTLGLAPSFGFGDRMGLATPGHVAAMNRAGSGIAPIFPQQSIREMTRTGRTAQQVMQEALAGAEAAGWTGPVGADADHLKVTADVDTTFAAGFTFFTIDPSDEVDQQADQYDAATVRAKFAAIQDQVGWCDQYRGKTVALRTGTRIELTEGVCLKAAVKYGRAIERALVISDYIAAVHQDAGRDFEIELSVDETEQPTTLAEHFIIADQCLNRGMKLVSLAPRFVGSFEKGIDFKGDLDGLAQSLAEHAAIAATLGPYKLSLHSGSDKLSMYPLLARATAGRFHVKTAGTSYLEALRVVARHDPDLFRELIGFARDRYPRDRATYHVSAQLSDAPEPSQADDASLQQEYLQHWSDVPEGRGFTRPGRQILHCTFGSVLTDARLGPQVHDCVQAHPETYAEILEEHFGRHLAALQ